MSRELTEKLLKVFVDTGDLHMSYRELAAISAKEMSREIIDREHVGRLMHESWSRTKRARGFHGSGEDCTYDASPDNPLTYQHQREVRYSCKKGEGMKPNGDTFSYRCGYYHPDLIPWDDLPEKQKDINRHAFDDVLPYFEGLLAAEREKPRLDDWEQNEPDMDMPPEAVAYNKGWDEGTIQAQAEVLAACDKVIHAYCARYGALDASNNTFRTCRELQKRISELQPAAKDLEELLEEARRGARLNELKDWPELCNIIHCVHGRNCMYHRRIAELEKARAEGKG